MPTLSKIPLLALTSPEAVTADTVTPSYGFNTPAGPWIPWMPWIPWAPLSIDTSIIYSNGTFYIYNTNRSYFSNSRINRICR